MHPTTESFKPQQIAYIWRCYSKESYMDNHDYRVVRRTKAKPNYNKRTGRSL